jgi:hypothetical protein
MTKKEMRRVLPYGEKPANFEKWDVGDSLPVVGNSVRVGPWVFWTQRNFPKMKFDLQSISDTLTRVTRIA